MAKLIRTNGRDNKNLPPNANNNAKIIDMIKIEVLTDFVIFFEGTLAINFNNK